MPRGVKKPKPCPNRSCLDPDNVQVSHYPAYRVECEGCGMSGPMSTEKKTKNDAVKLWDELPR